MFDPRIREYRKAAEAIANGQYQIDIPAGSTDEIGRLGQTLIALGNTLERKFEEIRKLTEVTAKINAGLHLEDVLGHVYDSFRTIIPYDRIGFSLLVEHGTVVRAMWMRSEAPEIKLRAGYTARLEGSSLQKIIETGHPRILNDLEAYLRANPASHPTRTIVAEGMRSNLTCPLIAMGNPIGFIFFSSMKPNTYANVHVDLFVQIAGQVAVIVEKARLYQGLLEAKGQLEQANRELARLADVDGLTGIPNRRYFDALFELEWRRARRESTPLSLMLIDIDFFKEYNDTYGHQRGDDCLKQVASTLSQTVQRASDFVARYGGEEFAVLLANTDAVAAGHVAETLCSRVEALHIRHTNSQVSRYVTISLGSATLIPNENISPRAFIDAADRALYQAKGEGRNQSKCVDFTP